MRGKIIFSKLSHRFRWCCACLLCVFLFLPDVHAGQDVHDSLFELQSQIQGYRTRIEDNLKEATSLDASLELVETRKKKLALEKSLTRLELERVSGDLTALGRRIAQHIRLISRERELLRHLLQNLDITPSRRFAVALLGSSLTGMFDEVRGLERVHDALQDATRVLRQEQRELAAQRKNLEKKQEIVALLHESQLRQEFALQEEDERLANLQRYTRKQKVLFEELLRRSELSSIVLQEKFFKQEGVGREIPLREAYARAENVTKRIGIRPTLLLAVVAQESRFGAQQGTGNWQEDMDPAQWQAFLQIVQRLGLNPDAVPVSKKPSYGWGGALGPAQFLSTTWLSHEAAIREMTGNALPSPWNVDDAFAGVALKLAEGGATARTLPAERQAALRYFAGDNWDNPAFGFYGDSIISLTRSIEQELQMHN